MYGNWTVPGVRSEAKKTPLQDAVLTSNPRHTSACKNFELISVLFLCYKNVLNLLSYSVTFNKPLAG